MTLVAVPDTECAVDVVTAVVKETEVAEAGSDVKPVNDDGFNSDEVDETTWSKGRSRVFADAEVVVVGGSADTHSTAISFCAMAFILASDRFASEQGPSSFVSDLWSQRSITPLHSASRI